MSGFKKLSPSDVFLTTYPSRKSWSISSSLFENYGLEKSRGITGSLPFYVESEDYNESILYKSIVHLYYSNETPQYETTSGSNGTITPIGQGTYLAALYRLPSGDSATSSEDACSSATTLYIVYTNDLNVNLGEEVTEYFTSFFTTLNGTVPIPDGYYQDRVAGDPSSYYRYIRVINGLVVQTGECSLQPTVLYISSTGSGSLDGSTPENAGPESSLQSYLNQEPDIVYVLDDISLTQNTTYSGSTVVRLENDTPTGTQITTLGFNLTVSGSSSLEFINVSLGVSPPTGSVLIENQSTLSLS